jgi:hypothetical protein
MPKIFTGKVVIPGEHLGQYLEALVEAEDARAPFRAQLEELNTEFGAYLATKYGRKTVLSHTGVIDTFIDFLCDYTDLERIEDVTRGMVNSGFRGWYRRKVWGGADPDQVRVALTKFFRFLATGKGIVAPKALEALR